MRPSARLLLVAAVFSRIITVSAAPPDAKQARRDYISKYSADAVREMKKSGVPASITLAQGCLESSDGKSPLALEANNHFGIKCADWSGPGFYQDDDAPNECFRKYASALESFDDHSNFLRSRPRYSALFELEPTDYKGWARGLKQAGYATDPTYADRLIKIIEEFELHQYDVEGAEVLLAAGKQNKETKPGIPDPAPVPQPSVSAPKSGDVIASTSNEPIFSAARKSSSGKIFVPTVEPVNVFSERKVLLNNGAKYVIARRGDNFKSLAEELQLGYWQLPKYNELPMDASLKEGQMVYITPKRSSCAQDHYTVREGDTIHSISQQLGVKSKFLCSRNGLQPNDPLKPGLRLQVASE